MIIEKRQVKVNNGALAVALGLTPGAVVDVKCKNGVPLEREWRNRFRDMAIDNCISIIDKPAVPIDKKTTKRETS